MKVSNMFSNSLVVSSRGAAIRAVLEGQHINDHEYLQNCIETELWDRIDVYTFDGNGSTWVKAIIPRRRGDTFQVLGRVLAVRIEGLVYVYVASLADDKAAHVNTLELKIDAPYVGHDRWTKYAIDRYRLDELLQHIKKSTQNGRNMRASDESGAKPGMRPKEFAEGLRALFKNSRVSWIPLDYLVLKGTFYSERLTDGRKRAAIRFLESHGVAVNQYACADDPSLWVFYLKEETPPFVDELNERPASGLDLYAEHQRQLQMAS